MLSPAFFDSSSSNISQCGSTQSKASKKGLIYALAK